MSGIILMEIPRKSREVLLWAYDYGVDREGFITDLEGNRVPSQENPIEEIHIDEVLLVPGSLEVLDGTPSAISKYLREQVEPSD